MKLKVKLKNGIEKEFLCTPNEDGSFDQYVFNIALKQADEYLDTLF